MIVQPVNAIVVPQELPRMYNAFGERIDKIKLGQQVTISQTIVNDKNVTQAYVILFEIRDERNFTIHLAFQNSTLAPNSQVDVGTSWLADHRGENLVRILVGYDFKPNLPPDTGYVFFDYVCNVSEIESVCRYY